MELKQNMALWCLPKLTAFNRTLWNWNVILVIVLIYKILSFNRTLWNWNQGTVVGYTVIISFNRTLWNWNSLTPLFVRFLFSFNRTLWNWNEDTKFVTLILAYSFNRTLWNWNKRLQTIYSVRLPLLIVPYGIETKQHIVLAVALFRF